METGPAVSPGDRDSGSRPAAAVAVTSAQHARRRRIVEAALDMLTERPYDSIQIRDVAVRAGVALGTLYRYFPSKDQLFAAVMLEWSSGFTDQVRRRRPEAVDDPERLRLLLRRAVRAFERHPHFFQLITVLGASSDPAVAEPFAAYTEAFSASIVDAVSGTDPLDTPVIVTLSTSLLDSLLRTWWLGRLRIASVEEQVDRAVEVMFRGARPVSSTDGPDRRQGRRAT